MPSNNQGRRTATTETQKEREERLKGQSQRNTLYAPGGYMSTRNADGSSRGAAAEMFERYGFF